MRKGFDFTRTAGARQRRVTRRMERRIKIAARFFPISFVER
jgi:hypothetical protein